MTGGFDMSIEGWGLEDLRLAGAVLGAKLEILRSPDIELVHVFHGKDCPADLPEKQMKDCISTKASHYGPKIALYEKFKPETNFTHLINHENINNSPENNSNKPDL